MEHRKDELTIPMAKAQLLAIPFFGLAAVMVIPYWMLYGNEALKAVTGFLDLRVFLPSLILGIVLHELIHGLAWTWASGNGFETVKFGFQWKTLTPYAHSKVPMTAGAYRTGAAMPLLLMGILPYFVALAGNFPILLGFGIFYTIAAAGDMMILFLMRNLESNQLVQDHPTKAGLILVNSGQN